MIIGDGPEKNNLNKLAHKLRINNRIMFLGYIPREKIPYALASSDLFVFTSKTETQGLVLLEATASKKPIVAIHDTAIEEYVYNNVNGFISEYNFKDFAQKIEMILNNRDLYKKFSNNSIKIAREFSLEKQTKKLIEVYNKLIDPNISV